MGAVTNILRQGTRPGSSKVTHRTGFQKPRSFDFQSADGFGLVFFFLNNFVVQPSSMDKVRSWVCPLSSVPQAKED